MGFSDLVGRRNDNEGREGSQIRNRSAANRSMVDEGSVLNSNRLPSIGVKRRNQGAPAVDLLAENRLLNDRLNKQQNKVEQEIKKYDEILKRNKNLRHYSPKKNGNLGGKLGGSNNYGNSSIIEHSSSVVNAKDLIKIYGVKLDNRVLDAKKPQRSKERLVRSPHLPSLQNGNSLPKGLVAAKYIRLN